MVEDSLCAACQAWMCRSDDAWCGFCGSGCARLHMEAIPQVLEAQQIAPQVCFALTNHSCSNLELEPSMRLPAWLTMPMQSGLKVGAGETVRLWAEARTIELQGAMAAEIVVATRAGDARAELLVLAERTEVIISPPEIVFWSVKEDNRGRGPGGTALSISPEAGCLRILTVRPEMARQLAVTGFTGARTASRHDPVCVEVQVDDERLLSERWPPSLVVEYEGPHGSESVTIAVPVVVKQAPQLNWDGANDSPAERFFSECQMVDVELSNRSLSDGGGKNAELVVDSVRLTAPSWLGAIAERTTELPLRLEGGEKETVTFKLDISAAGAGDRAGQLVHFELEVKSNAGTLRGKLPLRLEPLQVFDGFVAIDFGSSNTCCAVVHPGERPAFLNLDEDRTVAPTIVRYLDLSTKPAEIAVGAIVKEMAAQSEEVAASTVRGLKQLLGAVRENIDVRPKNSDEWMTRRASEAAADYLRAIRRLAEAQEHAIFRDFILTHPARCPLRQYRRMREALQEAFGQTGPRIEYMQEPIAALIPLMVTMAEKAIPPDYTVASFDLGGGTTDVAVLRVRQTCGADGEIEIAPEILFCEGIRFGGEALTDYLERALRARCVAQLGREEPGWEVISDDIATPAKADVLMNSAELRLAAERLKASLDQESDGNEQQQVTLHVRRKDGGTEIYPFRFAALCVEGGSDLRGEFIKHVGMRVDEWTRLLDPAEARGISIQIIQISGKTAYLKEVGRTVQRRFPKAEVRRAVNPKECVVQGACLARTMRTGRIRLKLQSSTHRMTSSIGIWPSRMSPFLPILRADTEFSSDALEASIPFVWDGLESISLWENTGADEDDPISLSDRGLLVRLGSWQPESKESVGAGALLLRLLNLRVEVALLGEGGSVMRCVPTQGGLG